MNPEETCNVCYFWFPDEAGGRKQGECRVTRPNVQAIPVPSIDPNQQKYTVMPLPVVTTPDYGCGEWEPKESPPEDGMTRVDTRTDEQVKAALKRMP